MSAIIIIVGLVSLLLFIYLSNILLRGGEDD